MDLQQRVSKLLEPLRVNLFEFELVPQKELERRASVPANTK